MKSAFGGLLFGTLLGGRARAAQEGSAYDYSFTAIDGGDLPLKSFAGKALLVVNTASKCGFTPQYKGLEALWDDYRERGLVVLGVPCNDFGGQEPGSSEEIVDFCTTSFDVSFPMTEKVHVTGSHAHPFYRWARATLGVVAAPKWNFHKYLVSPNGQLVDWFSTVTEPGSDKVRKAIEVHLPKA